MSDYVNRNAQGDIVKLIDNNKNTVLEYTYDSWGKILATTGSLATSLGANQPFRYRGYVYDIETGWYYLQSRYYDPTTRRFISSDMYLSTGQGVLGHNAYAYCLNNSVNAEDPTGHWSWFTGGRNRENVADGGTGLYGGGGWDCRYRYNNRNGYSSGYSSSHSNRYTSKANPQFDANQSALINLAKDFKRGVTMNEAKILTDWAREYGINYHLPMKHENRSGRWSDKLHIKIHGFHIGVIK